MKPIWEMGHALFRQRLDLRQRVRSRLVAALLASVEKYRNKQSCDRDVLGRMCSMLHTMGLYAQLERPLLAASSVFFQAEGRALVASCDAAAFLRHVEGRLTEAVEMAQRYLLPCSQVRACMHACMLSMVFDL